MVVKRRHSLFVTSLLLVFVALAAAKEFYQFPQVTDIQARDIYMLRRPAKPGFPNYTGTKNITGAAIMGTMTTVGVSRARFAAEVATLQADIYSRVPSTDPRLSDARPPLTHNQGMATIDGLQAALDGKSATTHDHAGVYDPAGAAAAVTAASIGLGNVNNTSDANKPVSTATQTALDGKEAVGAAAAAISSHNAAANHPATTSNLTEGTNLYFTTGRAAAAAPVQSVASRTGAVTISTSDVSGYVAPVNADWAAATGLALILNKPAFTRGYDGKEVEIQTNGTYVQWRYVGDTSWINLIALSAITGAPGSNGTNGTNGTDGKTYSCAITGGIRTLEYDKNGANPAPTMTAFSVELRENGTVVTPATWSWTTPVTSLLSGSGSAATFTPTVAGTFVAATDNRVDVAVTYAGTTCQATAPVPATKIGADGAAGSPDTKAQIYTKIGTGTTGDVLNTQCGSGDASSFAGRTVRVGSGDIHRADLCGGSTWIHAQSGDAASAQKLGVKSSAGTALSYFTADGSLVIKGSITIK